jgi:excisionase family DNA binding protein
MELSIDVPAELVEAIAARAAELVLERIGAPTPVQGPRYLHGAAKAAEYLDVPLGQVQKLTAAGVIPHRKLSQRCLYRTDELDEWLDGYYEGPAVDLPRLRAV